MLVNYILRFSNMGASKLIKLRISNLYNGLGYNNIDIGHIKKKRLLI